MNWERKVKEDRTGEKIKLAGLKVPSLHVAARLKVPSLHVAARGKCPFLENFTMPFFEAGGNTI